MGDWWDSTFGAHRQQARLCIGLKVFAHSFDNIILCLKLTTRVARRWSSTSSRRVFSASALASSPPRALPQPGCWGLRGSDDLYPLPGTHCHLCETNATMARCFIVYTIVSCF